MEGTTGAEDLIRMAYWGLCRGRRNPWVRLADLRARADGLWPDDFDEAIRGLNLRPDAVVIPEENRKALTDADRAAAVRIHGEDRHLLAIEDEAE